MPVTYNVWHDMPALMEDDNDGHGYDLNYVHIVSPNEGEYDVYRRGYLPVVGLTYVAIHNDDFRVLVTDVDEGNYEAIRFTCGDEHGTTCRSCNDPVLFWKVFKLADVQSS